MIKPEIYYEVTCDQCGEKFCDGDTIIAFGSIQEAVHTVSESGWLFQLWPEPGCRIPFIKEDPSFTYDSDDGWRSLLGLVSHEYLCPNCAKKKDIQNHDVP